MRPSRTRHLTAALAGLTTLGLAALPLIAAPASAAPAPRLQVTVTADRTTAGAGEAVTYSLSARNAGTAVAKAAVLTHTVPDGMTLVKSDCDRTGATVTCSLGDLPAGATAVRTVVATVDAFTAPAPADSGHRLTYVKQESFVELPAGGATTASLACPAGHVVTDGSLQLDSVHASGATDVFTTQSRATTVDGRSGWEARVVNDGQRATGKLRISCLDATTTGAGHSHALTGGGTQLVATKAKADDDGLITATSAGCASGQLAIAPSFRFAAGSGLMTSSRPTGAGWTFTAEELQEGSVLEASVACLDLTTAAAHGHSARLAVRSVDPVVRQVGAGASGSVEASCGSSAYAVSGGFATDEPGLLEVGFDPRYETRSHQFFNDSGDAAAAEVGVVCLEAGLVGERGSKQVTSTAVLTSGSTTASGSTTITVIATGEPVTPAVTVGKVGRNAAGSTLKVQVSCGAAACTLTGKALSLGQAGIKKGTQVAYGKLKLTAGETRALTLGVRKAYRGAVKSGAVSRLTLSLRGGGVDERVDISL
ncbi:hypothetical protein NOK12_36330 [Nocardioides sp. OK12]|uniref:DUF11 domain-containing protein n=1 Tax=Nocardioides sp. OK12 TaxID=2758661 RepID=UPI0021C36349|nr:DUF11 domain-containing protein [Nocardioides sp. OK12]GHJ61115.1 hypothetical protein NOK12_36330 [Nocardioides sp. OK12]